MQDAQTGLHVGTISFGPFRLMVRERLLLQNDQPVPLRSRALDLLVALLVAAPRAIDKRVLMAQVWPGVVVEEVNLRVQVTALRKILGDGKSGARYIVTVPGRGYAFVGEVNHNVSSEPAPVLDTAYALPGRPRHLLGRDDVLRVISTRLLSDRFVTIVGPGGIGKTTLAIWLGHELLKEFDGQVCVVDLAAVANPDHVAGAVASALGIPINTSDMAPAVMSFLRRRRLMLILDSCEHMIDSVAAIAEQIYRQVPDTFILTTSREALRVEGEQIYRLDALDTPPREGVLGAAAALSFSAVRLFVARVISSQKEFELSDEDASVVAEICRSLDGIPLAIELAASRIETFGITETARLLNGSFLLGWRGRRTAPARHQTLAATLDWSHALLLEAERISLRRLAIFVGSFGLSSAMAVASDNLLDERMVLDSIAGLAAKSLLTVELSGKSYRLLDTTRAYAFQKLESSGELNSVARRHALSLYHSLLREREVMSRNGPGASTDMWDKVGNVQAALEWCFGRTGDAALGGTLAAAFAPLLLRFSLLTECIRWMELALATLDEAAFGGITELELRASLGVSLMFTNGNSDRVVDAFHRSMQIAEGIGALEHQVRLLGWLNVVHLRMGRIRDALVHAERSAEVARHLGDPNVIAAADAFLGSNYNLLGRNREARASLTGAIARGLSPEAPLQLGFSTRNHALTSLALTLWVLGQPERAVATALESIAEAGRLGHPSTLCIALLYGASVLLWAGELDQAEAHIEHFLSQAEIYSLKPYIIAGSGLKGEIAIRRGQVDVGIRMLLTALDALRPERYKRRMTIFCGALAEGYLRVGRLDEALATIDEAISISEQSGELLALPELFRIKGEILACMPETGMQTSESLLLHSIACARSQDALSWELRGAMSLATSWSHQGRDLEAMQLLRGVYDRFTEGFSMRDLCAARQLIDDLERRVGECSRSARNVGTPSGAGRVPAGGVARR